MEENPESRLQQSCNVIWNCSWIYLFLFLENMTRVWSYSVISVLSLCKYHKNNFVLFREMDQIDADRRSRSEHKSSGRRSKFNCCFFFFIFWDGKQCVCEQMSKVFHWMENVSLDFGWFTILWIHHLVLTSCVIFHVFRFLNGIIAEIK